MSYMILDADFLAYTVACVYQETYIMATHPAIKEPVKLKNKTELYGDWRKKDGGFVLEYNQLNFTDLKADDFTWTEHQEPLSLKEAKKSVSTRIQGLLDETGAEYYRGYVGRGEVFRVEMSTLWKYKDNRADTMRPYHLTALKQYLVDDHNCTWVEKLESDDAVAIDGAKAYNTWKTTRKSDDKGILVFEDRDLCQVDGWQYQVGRSTKPELRVGFGELYRDDKGKVRGWGRKHLYWQMMRHETSDNFAAQCFSDVKWGDVSAFKLLDGATNDKQAFEALCKGFKTLYPEPKTIIGWRGEPILIDWLYVFNECFNLSKMLRSADEKPTDVKAVLTKLGIPHD